MRLEEISVGDIVQYVVYSQSFRSNYPTFGTVSRIEDSHIVLEDGTKVVAGDVREICFSSAKFSEKTDKKNKK